jgi:hypothetical protein
MTEDNARTVANLILVAAGVAAAYIVIMTPPLRRMTLRALRLWLGATVPVYLANEARAAWVESGRPA